MVVPLEKIDLPYLLISGFLGNGIPSFLFAYAELKISSAVAGMLNSLVPVFTIVIAAVFFSFAWKIKHIIGILTGILGTCLIVFKFNQPEQISTPILPILMVLSGSLCYAISLNIIKYKLQHLHPNLITSVSFLFIGIPSLFYLLSTDFYGLILIGEIDPKFLVKFINEQGKLLPRRLTGTSAKYQKKVSQAVKRARHLAILPYVVDRSPTPTFLKFSLERPSIKLADFF